MKKCRNVLLAALFLCLAPTQISALDFTLSSFADYYGGIEPSKKYENLRTRLFARPKLSGFAGDTAIEWTISGNFWIQGFESELYNQPINMLNEAYVFFPIGNMDITVGQKRVDFGFADVYSSLNAPLSAFKAGYSLDDPWESRRADPLVQCKLFPSDEDVVELVYVPVTRPDVEQNESVFLPGSKDTIQWRTKPYITENLHSLFAVYSRYGETIDLQFLYGWYTEHTPDFVIDRIDSNTATDIRPEYNKKHTFAGAYSRRVGSTTLSQEFAFNLTDNFSGKNIGAQKSDITVNSQVLVNLPAGILSQHSIIYSYFFNHNAYDDKGSPETALYLANEVRNFHNQPYAHIAFIVSHFEKAFLREKLKAAINIGFFFSPNVYIAPRLSYSITDYWAFETGMDYTLGKPPAKDLRRNPQNDNFYVRLLFRY